MSHTFLNHLAQIMKTNWVKPKDDEVSETSVPSFQIKNGDYSHKPHDVQVNVTMKLL